MTPGFALALGRAFRDELGLLHETQWMTSSQLQEFRRRRLLRVLGDIAAPPGGCDPEEILGRWPVARRSRERETRFGGLVGRRTSGTSGTAVVIPTGRRAYAQMLAAFWRALGWWGVFPGDRGLVLLGSSAPARLRPLLQGKDALLGAHRVFVEEGAPWRARARRSLERVRYGYLYGYPSALFEMARREPPPEVPPRVVVTTGEPLFEFQRRAIAIWAGAPVAEEYGCAELGSVAVQCPQGTLHLVAEQVWVENGPPPLATSLLMRPRPVVRLPLPEPVVVRPHACPCGRRLPAVQLGERATEAWEAVEEAALSVGPPARFRVVTGDSWRLTLEEGADRSFADALLRAARERGRDVTVVCAPRLPRGPAGKFRYLGVSP